MYKGTYIQSSKSLGSVLWSEQFSAIFKTKNIETLSLIKDLIILQQMKMTIQYKPNRQFFFEKISNIPFAPGLDQIFNLNINTTYRLQSMDPPQYLNHNHQKHEIWR
jgi:hypothetical protein